MIDLKILKLGDEAQLEAFLLPRIESSMFLLGNMRMAGLVDNGRHLQGTYAAAFEQDKIIGVVAHYWNGNLILQAPLDLVGRLVETAVSASNRPIHGFLGSQSQVETAVNHLQIKSTAIQLDDKEKLYSLPLENLRVPSKLATGQWRGRPVQPADLELIVRWRLGYAVETMGESDSPELRERLKESVKKYQKLGRIWVLEDGGQPVAMSAFNATSKEAVQVGGVWTPPEFRSKGYGRCAVAVSLLDARDEGVETAVLFTGEDNIPAQKAYEALGFHHIGDYRILLLN